jgi:hypothetical protein
LSNRLKCILDDSKQLHDLEDKLKELFYSVKKITSKLNDGDILNRFLDITEEDNLVIIE